MGTWWEASSETKIKKQDETPYFLSDGLTVK